VPPVLEDNKMLVRGFFADVERGDVAAAFARFTDDGTWYSNGGRGDTPAREMVAKIAWFVSNMEHGIHYDFGHFTAEDDRVAVTVECHAPMKNGTLYNNVFHFLFEVDDGKIRRACEYADTSHAATIVGGLPGVDAILGRA
jgi:ketosteroid isomerase-like protein